MSEQAKCDDKAWIGPKHGHDTSKHGQDMGKTWTRYGLNLDMIRAKLGYDTGKTWT